LEISLKLRLLTGTAKYSPSEGLHASDFPPQTLPFFIIDTSFLMAIYYETKAAIERNNSSMNVHINNKSH